MGEKESDSDEIRTRAGNPSRIEDGPKRDAVTTWLHCRVEGGTVDNGVGSAPH